MNEGTSKFGPEYLKGAFPAAVVDENCRPTFEHYTTKEAVQPDVPGSSVRNFRKAGSPAMSFEERSPSGENGMGRIRRVHQAQIGTASKTEVFEEDWSVFALQLEYRPTPEACRALFLLEMLDRIFDSFKLSPLSGSGAPTGGTESSPTAAGPVQSQFGDLRRGGAPSQQKPPPRRAPARPPEPDPVKTAAREAQRQILKAKSYWIDGHLRSASDNFQKALELNPASYESHFAFAAIMKLMGSETDWETHIEKAKDLNDKLEKKIGGFLGRRKKGRKAPKDAADDAMLAISDGLIHEAFGRTDKAMDSYSKAVAAAPDHWLAYAYRGILRTQFKDCGGAVADLEAAVRINYLYKYQARYWLGQCR